MVPAPAGRTKRGYRSALVALLSVVISSSLGCCSKGSSASTDLSGAAVSGGSRVSIYNILNSHVGDLGQEQVIGPISIGSVQVLQYRATDQGLVKLRDVLVQAQHPEYRLAVDDDLKVHAELQGSAFWYLLVIEPAGRVSQNITRHDSLLRRSGDYEYPEEESTFYGLTHGPGTYAFVLVGSRKPLSVDDAWWASHTSAWASAPGIWRFDSRASHRAVLVQDDRDPRRHGPLTKPETFEALCRTLQSLDAVDAVYGVALNATAN